MSPGMRDETLLAFDFGMKRIGVAIGELRLGQARDLTTIHAEANEIRFSAIEKLLAEWRPGRLIVGRPLNDDASPHDMTARCERFANQLHGRYGLPVELVDERFSSVEADADLRQRGLDWRQRKARVDAVAARIILQNWFDAHVPA
jgi:putative Holliday junction resolvase